MQKFLSLLFSRRALAVVGVLVLALLVWFVGPLVSFDTLRPLASVGTCTTGAAISSKSTWGVMSSASSRVTTCTVRCSGARGDWTRGGCTTGRAG
ncbi:hypothetical protein R523_17625 [Salmonella enterica subsp. enterica serovar Holcomb]|nr:hypothetical protein R535_17175 [Salmonella enterica subsp. enterica serovar Holcomb]OSE03134.1 hypothetical protein R523_17625 [Salmonella enterica subsp. enterica serovar Holcomb]